LVAKAMVLVLVLVQGAMVEAKMGERNERELPRYE